MKKLPILLVLLALVAVPLWLWWSRGNGPVVPDGPAAMIPPEEFLAALEQRNVAVGELENYDFDEAAERFAQLAERFPDDPLPARNLAVARVLKIGQIGQQQGEAARTEAVADAEVALSKLAKVEPDGAAGHFLEGRLATATDDPQRALEALHKAAQADPDNAALWFEYAQAARYSDDPAVQEAAWDALAKAAELAPDNLFVLLQLLEVQAAQQDEAFLQTFEQARPLLEFLADGVKRRARIELKPFLDRAEAAAREGDWKTARTQIMLIGNVSRPDNAVRSDKDRIELHELDFVLTRFAPSFYEQAPEMPPAPPGIPVTFEAFAEQPELTVDGPVLDVAVADVDIDGRLDLCVLTEGRLVVLRSDETEGWQSFLEADVPTGCTHLVVADLDDDAGESPQRTSPPDEVDQDDPFFGCNQADIDFVVYGDSGVRVLENRRDPETEERTLIDRTDQSPALMELQDCALAMVADLDLDGDLDLLVSTRDGRTRILARTQLWTFEDVTAQSEMPGSDFVPVAGVAVDWDNDVDIDVVLADEAGRLGLLENLRHSTFRWRLWDVRLEGAAASLDVAGLDDRVGWSLVAGAESGAGVVSTGIDHSVSAPVPMGEGSAGQVLKLWDYDNDGDLDVMACGPNGVQVWRGDGTGGFTLQEKPLESVEWPENLVACDYGDIDNDGDLDLIAAGADGLQLLSNEGGNANGWLGVTLASQYVAGGESTQTRRVNHYGYGCTLELKAGELYQRRPVHRQQTHFGLGGRSQADVVRIMWTNGVPQNILQPDSRQLVCEEETPKGSCPFLYTWNGERYTFVTDLCWAAPLGLVDPRGGLMPCREWEYLLVEGDLLQAKDGAYELQVTEELWEAAYFDQIELIAVDHPAEVDIFSNEKVGPPAIAEYHIHTVREKRHPVAATTHRGENILPQVVARDDVYARPFAERRMQGYTEETWIELDLGELAAGQDSPPERITLFLTGWIFPTDTSINVALSQDTALPGPQPPSLLVPDADGSWQQAIPYTGFPGGKTKTIAIDLSDVFLTDDYRVRLATSMQFCWDEIFFTVDEEPGEVREQPLPLLSADLHYRGFSRRTQRPDNAPDWYDYHDVRTAPVWPPMDGRFTRYGDVTELVRDADDRQVVMASGDEMTLRFAVPDTPLPAGWKRDFIMHNIGWDKDADLNTLYGATADPLPYRGMSTYPYVAPESFPMSERHRRDMDEFHTRRTGDRTFRQLIRAWQPGEDIVGP
ncbi:FG-GAP-like repeat-containing protein [Maioricimonas sp. JC845]|uniref:FG-GAP-like repeat-containing protein n=1 Tax=Maioricimonas sp. JC845 TaxID=3232138 RepID=UPI0034592303